MTDREKVLQGLYCCAANCQNGCPYSDISQYCSDVLAKDALELLKEADEICARYSKVLMETTGNKLSKTGYDVTYIMDCIREHYCDGCDVKEERDALLKEREPVEMTVEDVLAFEGIEEPVRVEDLTGGNYTQAAFVRGTGGEGAARYVEFTGKRCSYVLLVKDYGVRWKCWRI